MPVWAIPIAYTLVSLIAAVALPRLEHIYQLGEIGGLSPSSAIASLSAIASGMMALTGIVFSVAFILLQFSAIAYSPRFATRFARDPLLFHSLGTFFATFTYALATTNWVDREGSGKVPLLSWTVAFALLIASLLMFTLLIRRVGDLQISSTLHFIGDEGRKVISELAATPQLRQAAQTPGAPVRDADGTKPIQLLRFRGGPRYVQRFDFAALVALAGGSDCRIEMACAVGDMVTDGTILARIHGARSPLPEQLLLRAIRTGAERTFEQDPKYPIRLLVDIAIKALSPAINDPTTAVQALDQIEDLLRRLVRYQLDVGHVPDSAGTLRLVFPTPTWPDYLSLAFDEIRMFGATSIQVMRRLRSSLVALLDELGEDPRAERVHLYLHHIDAVIERSLPDDEDRNAARQEDPQGLGLTR